MRLDQDADVRVLLEVIRQKQPTIPSIGRALEMAPSTVYCRLLRLRRHGLVTWEPRSFGTLRPCVEAVPTPVVGS